MICCTALDLVAIGIEDKLVANMLVLALAIDNRRSWMILLEIV